MKKRGFIFTLTILVVLVSLCGCSKRVDKNERGYGKGPGGSLAVATETPAAPTEELEGEPAQGTAPAPAGQTQPPSPVQASSQMPAVQDTLSGKMILNNGSVFGSIDGMVLGTEKELDAWGSVIAQQGQITKILVSTFNNERDLTEAEARSILDTLEALSPEVLGSIGNPPTGGDTNIIAYDSEEAELWRVTVNSVWLIVRMPGDSTPRLFGVKGQKVWPVLEICG